MGVQLLPSSASPCFLFCAPVSCCTRRAHDLHLHSKRDAIAMAPVTRSGFGFRRPAAGLARERRERGGRATAVELSGLLVTSCALDVWPARRVVAIVGSQGSHVEGAEKACFDRTCWQPYFLATAGSLTTLLSQCLRSCKRRETQTSIQLLRH